jgi:hypothetical protein
VRNSLAPGEQQQQHMMFQNAQGTLSYFAEHNKGQQSSACRLQQSLQQAKTQLQLAQQANCHPCTTCQHRLLLPACFCWCPAALLLLFPTKPQNIV